MLDVTLKTSVCDDSRCAAVGEPTSMYQGPLLLSPEHPRALRQEIIF